MRLCFWARSSPAPACVTASLRGPRRSSQQVGRGTRRGQKRRRNQSFRAAVSGEEGGGRRGRGEAEAANDRDPEATGKLCSRRRRGRRPHPKRTQSGLRAQLSPLRDGDGARGAREEGGVLPRDGEPSAAGTGPEGRGGSRASQDRSRLGKPPVPQASKESKPRKCVWWRGGDPTRRLPAAHPVPTPTRGAGHVCRGPVRGKAGFLGSSAREGACLARGARVCVRVFGAPGVGGGVSPPLGSGPGACGTGDVPRRGAQGAGSPSLQSGGTEGHTLAESEGKKFAPSPNFRLQRLPARAPSRHRVDPGPAPARLLGWHPDARHRKLRQAAWAY